MATRKKKTVSYEEGLDIPIMTDAKSVARKPKVTKPKIIKGSHLTVTEWPDGRTELKWDDEALLNEIREATRVIRVKSDTIENINKNVVTKKSVGKTVVKKLVKNTKA